MNLSRAELAILIDAVMVLMHERERLLREGVNTGDLSEEQALLDRLMSVNHHQEEYLEQYRARRAEYLREHETPEDRARWNLLVGSRSARSYLPE